MQISNSPIIMSAIIRAQLFSYFPIRRFRADQNRIGFCLFVNNLLLLLLMLKATTCEWEQFNAKCDILILIYIRINADEKVKQLVFISSRYYFGNLVNSLFGISIVLK